MYFSFYVSLVHCHLFPLSHFLILLFENLKIKIVFTHVKISFIFMDYFLIGLILKDWKICVQKNVDWNLLFYVTGI